MNSFPFVRHGVAQASKCYHTKLSFYQGSFILEIQGSGHFNQDKKVNPDHSSNSPNLKPNPNFWRAFGSSNLEQNSEDLQWGDQYLLFYLYSTWHNGLSTWWGSWRLPQWKKSNINNNNKLLQGNENFSSEWSPSFDFGRFKVSSWLYPCRAGESLRFYNGFCTASAKVGGNCGTHNRSLTGLEKRAGSLEKKRKDWIMQGGNQQQIRLRL